LNIKIRITRLRRERRNKVVFTNAGVGNDVKARHGNKKNNLVRETFELSLEGERDGMARNIHERLKRTGVIGTQRRLGFQESWGSKS